MRKSVIPKYVLDAHNLPNSAAFKVMKRRELREAIKAVDTLRVGCMFMPGYQRVAVVSQELRALALELRWDNWRVKRVKQVAP